jgi:hypothetical protein
MDYVFTFSLGNIGADSVACGSQQYAGLFNANNQRQEQWLRGNETIKLVCPAGSSIGRMIQFGLTKSAGSNCENIESNPY